MGWGGRDPAGPDPTIVRGGDLAAFWAGGAILDAGDGSSLYEPRRVTRELRLLFPPDPPRYRLAYPPPVYQVFASARALPYPDAASGILVLQAALAVLGTWLMVRTAGLQEPLRTGALALGAVAPPVLANLFTGQLSGFWMAILGAGLHLHARRKRLAGGLLLGLLWAKPTLAAPVGLALLGLGQWPCLLGFLVGGAVLMGASVWADPEAWLAYLQVLRQTPDVATHLWIRWPRQVSLRNLLGHLAGDRSWQVLLGWVGVTLGLAWTAWACRLARSLSPAGPPGPLAWGLALSTAFLTTPHLFDYDLGVYTPGLLATLAWIGSGRARRPRLGIWLGALAFLAPALYQVSRLLHFSLGTLVVAAWVAWMGWEAARAPRPVTA